MKANESSKVPRTLQDQIDASIEAAVNRLCQAGAPRIDALEEIHGGLTQALGILTTIGIGDFSRLRSQMVCAGQKLKSARAAATQHASAGTSHGA